MVRPGREASGVALAVSLEVHDKRTFAWAVAWPGWCRSARTEEAAIDSLLGYEARYRLVAERAGLKLGATRGIDVVERLLGDASTSFGVPGAVSASDRERLTARQALRQADLVEASWARLGEIAASAPAELRKGPRGGGRDRDKILDHVAGAEFSYARKLGIGHRAPDPVDDQASRALRDAIVAALRAARSGEPEDARGWPARYLARRIAWHALDHAWEIEDRSQPAG